MSSGRKHLIIEKRKEVNPCPKLTLRQNNKSVNAVDGFKKQSD